MSLESVVTDTRGKAAKYLVIVTASIDPTTATACDLKEVYEQVRGGGRKKLMRLMSNEIYSDGMCIVASTGALAWRSDELRAACIETQKAISGDDEYESRWEQVVAYRHRIERGQMPPSLHIGYVGNGVARLIDGARRCMALLEAGHQSHAVNIIFPKSLV